MSKSASIVLAALCGAAGTALGYDSIVIGEPVGAGALSRPVAAAAAGGRLYVLDEKKNALLILAPGGGVERSIDKPGGASFKRPRGLAIGPGGEVYVADTGNSRIVALDPSGEFVASWGGKGDSQGRFDSPQSIAVGGDGRVYVADTGNNRIQAFTDEGILLFAMGDGGKLPGEFEGPKSVAVDPSDNIYVLDSGNERVQKFDPKLNYIRDFPHSGDSLAVDPYGFIYLLDSGDGKIQELSPDGAVQGRPFGSSGKGKGQFKKPQGFSVDSEGLWIADTGNSRLQRITLKSRLKKSPLPPQRASRVWVSGPAVSWPAKARALAAMGGERLYAYLPEEGRFAVFGPDGAEAAARFGSKSGKAPSATRGSRGLAASAALGLFVSDTEGDRMQHFGLDGAWKRNFAEKEGFFDSKSKEGRVRGPRGVAINDEGTVYVADAGNRRVDAFSPDGGFIWGVGPRLGETELAEPAAVVFDGSALYFTDLGLKRAFKCEPSGALELSFGSEGSKFGRFQRPTGMAYDGRDYLYVLDSGLHRVSVYGKNGSWMTDLFSAGEGSNELADPAAIAILGPRLYVADQGKGKILGYDIHAVVAPPVEVSTAAREGTMVVKAKPSPEAWAAGVRVLRATAAAGPYLPIGSSKDGLYEDSAVEGDRTYYYRLATESLTGDVGPPGPALEAHVPAATNRPPVEIATVTLGNIFSANYKWYRTNPAGQARIVNNTNTEYSKVKLSFRLKEFMDFGYDTPIERLGPRQSVDIPLVATLNNRILEVSEDTPVQAEFELTYFEKGEPKRLTLTQSLRIYNRTAITWEDSRRIANFITPKDPPVLDYAGDVLRDAPELAAADGVNENVLTALHLWSALSEEGAKFVTNPASPYEKISEDPNFPVDYAQFPRDTLRHKRGQCDDLTTLLVSLLEAANVRAAILDYPGHMAPMLDTEATDPAEAGFPEEDLVLHDGTYWLPLEATLLGKSFEESRRRAAFAYRTEKAKDAVRVIDPRSAWESFEPATLPAPDAGSKSDRVPAKAWEKRVREDAAVLAGDRARHLRKLFEGRLKADGRDIESRLELALLDFQEGRADKALSGFQKVLDFDAANPAALNNIGNVHFLRGDFAKASEWYRKALDADREDAEVWLNLAKARLKAADEAGAKEAAAQAARLDPALGGVAESLVKGVSP